MSRPRLADRNSARYPRDGPIVKRTLFFGLRGIAAGGFDAAVKHDGRRGVPDPRTACYGRKK
jgi:hypothetical protein